MGRTHTRSLTVCTFANERATTAVKVGDVCWADVITIHARRPTRPGKSGFMLGGYKLVGPRANGNVLHRSLIQLDIDTQGVKDKATGRIMEVTRAAPSLDQIRSAIDSYEWLAASSHWHEPQRGVIKYRVTILPDRDILCDEHEPVLEALDERLGGVLDRDAWAWSQAFYLPSCPEENESDAFFVHNPGEVLPVDDFVRRGREILEARESSPKPHQGFNTDPIPGGLGDNTTRAAPLPPPAETMRAMLKHLVARDHFKDREHWIKAGMALKTAYGDQAGADLWSVTHEDERARTDAPGQWNSFAATAQLGHVTIGTLIKAARDAGFVLSMKNPTSIAAAAAPAATYVSHGPFTMDPNDGLTKQVRTGRSKTSAIELVWIAPPFEILGQCRDPNGRAWGKQIRFHDDDGRVHMHHVSDAALQGDPAGLCAELAGDGLRVDRARQRELAEYLNGVSVSERVTNVGKTGWHEVGGERVFVLPDAAISSGGGERVMLDAAAHGPYEARGSLEDWKRGVGALTAGHALPVFMVSAALAGPLAHLVGAEGGGVNVYGQSSIGKSAMLAAGASVWGRGGTPGYVRSWRATANGLEGAAASATDTCLVLDELSVGNPREVADSIYALANGSGKQRARRDGSLQEPKGWRVFVLSSGELPIETKIAEDFGRKTRAGQAVRLLDLPADRGLGFGVFDDQGGATDAGKLADEIKDAARSAYGTAGPEFVRRLIDRDLDRAAVEARRMVGAFVEKFVATGSSEQIARAAKKFALIGVAGEMATSLGVTPWAKGEAQRVAVWGFKRWLETRGGTGSHEEQQAIEQVRRLIVQHGDARFERVDGLPPLAGGAPIVRERLGWIKGDGDQREWWIPSETWKGDVCAGLDSIFVAKTLVKRGMLRRQDGKNLMSVVRPHGGQNIRCYVLMAAILGDEQGAEEADAP